MALAALIAGAFFFSPSCAEQERFRIYEMGAGKVVVSEKDIESYNGQEVSFTLNEKGIERWNSFQTYAGMPELGQTLVRRDFIITIDGREICRGKFWSYVLSMSYDGNVILDALMPFNEGNRTFKLARNYPAAGNVDPAIAEELGRFFGSRAE